MGNPIIDLIGWPLYQYKLTENIAKGQGQH